MALPHMLIANLHGDILRLAAAHAGKHFNGLQHASRSLRAVLGPGLTKKMRMLDVAYNIVRHVTVPGCDQFLLEVQDALAGDAKSMDGKMPVASNSQKEIELRKELVASHVEFNANAAPFVPPGNAYFPAGDTAFTSARLELDASLPVPRPLMQERELHQFVQEFVPAHVSQREERIILNPVLERPLKKQKGWVNDLHEASPLGLVSELDMDVDEEIPELLLVAVPSIIVSPPDVQLMVVDRGVVFRFSSGPSGCSSLRCRLLPDILLRLAC